MSGENKEESQATISESFQFGKGGIVREMEADKREWVSGTKNNKGKGLKVSNKARKQKKNDVNGLVGSRNDGTRNDSRTLKDVTMVGLDRSNGARAFGEFAKSGDSTEAVRVEDIDIIAWNYQSAGHPNFHKFLNEYLREFDLGIVVLVETRISGVKADKVIKNIGMANSHRVEACGFSRGIWILWKDTVTILKSRSNWLTLGDRNTKYFHSQANNRRRVNQINALKLEDRMWCYEDERLKYEAMSFYQRLYTDEKGNMGRFLVRQMFPTAEAEFLEALDQKLTTQKFHDALFGMSPLKALKINGLHAQFYQ
ncbi:hypothetical protein J1N35_009968 [Gossypium stocksii]|uniref:Uncharacterized protein n=1 Tax=Gossypium stocksii TaxID=47602 RepID=A0A9D4AC62_9ROSI|nr:hypothetical protein J1N35_009968 [Gossypium stocksii]